jgi:MoaA/NifB/PqqE/SkfB family radical SAM enzyme
MTLSHYVEVNFNNACNLKCSYCSPQFSSSWADEVGRMGGYATAVLHNSLIIFPDHDRRIFLPESIILT